MIRIRLVDSEGNIRFDSHRLRVPLPADWNLLLHEALSGRLQMWQQDVTDARPYAATTGQSPFTLIDDMEQLLRYLLVRGAQVNVRSQGQELPLVTAVEAGNEVAVRVLHEHGARDDVTDSEGRFLQVLAVHSGSENILQMVLQPEVSEAALNFAMFAAVATARDSMLKMLFKSGAMVNRLMGLHDLSTLTLAAIQHHLSTMRLLLACGADSNLRTPYLSPLMIAAMSGQWSAMDLLVENGAAIDVFNRAGESVREVAGQVIRSEVPHIAHGEGMAEVTSAIEDGVWSRVAALLEVSATAPVRNPGDADNAGDNALDWAVLLRLSVQGGVTLIALEVIAAASRIEPGEVDSLIDLAMAATLAMDSPDFALIDHLRDWGADLYAPVVGTDTIALDLAADRQSHLLATQLEDAAADRAVDSEAFLAEIEELLQGPLHPWIKTEIEAAVQQVIEQVIESSLHAALLEASQHSPTQVETIIEIFLRTEQALPLIEAATNGMNHAVETVADSGNGVHAGGDSADPIFPDSIEAPAQGDAEAAALLDANILLPGGGAANLRDILPFLIAAGLGFGYYSGQL